MDLHLSKAFSTEQWKKQKEMEKDLGMEEVGAFDLPDIVVDDAIVSGAVDSLNNGQRTIFDEVMKKIADGDSLPMFISGTGNDVLVHQNKTNSVSLQLGPGRASSSKPSSSQRLISTVSEHAFWLRPLDSLLSPSEDSRCTLHSVSKCRRAPSRQ